jgi:hypothetical protein
MHVTHPRRFSGKRRAGVRERARWRESDAEAAWRAGARSAGDRFGVGDGESPEFAAGSCDALLLPPVPFLCCLSEVKLIHPLLHIAPSCPQGRAGRRLLAFWCFGTSRPASN